MREDLMPGIMQAVAGEAQTVRTLAGRFGIDVPAMQATVRHMHQKGVLAVSMVGATWVCRPA
ncbi:hypothetical protein ACFSC4_28990 [Deinococcus malanensis]|uniref:hypothetical protein n=1 Tax=Deinococcus malanensis TaxID=1706855 RepID=UPI0036305CC0